MIKDLRHALRLLCRTPALTTVAILSLAITIGITGVVFTALKSVLIDPLPYSRPGELVVLRSGGEVANWVNWSDMQDVDRRNRALHSLGTYHYALFNLKADSSNPPQALYGLYVSASLFPTLGVTPMIGRNIEPGEDTPGREREVILSYGLWARRFNSDRNVVGRALVANGYNYTIIGVMPPGFDFPLRLATTARTPSRYMEFWAPSAVDPAKAIRDGTGYGAIARLKPAMTVSEANQDLASIAKSLAREYPLSNKDREIRAVSLERQTIGAARPALLLLMAAAALFMLIGCSNVANLLLSRSLARQREIAIRMALGASRSRIVRQLMTESCVLAIAGGLCGYLLTAAAWRLLPIVVPSTIPRLDTAHPDWTIFTFTLAVSVVNGLLFGAVPALRMSGSGSAGPAGRRLRSAFVVAEMAITVVLVIVGGVLTASFVRLLRNDLGFEPSRVLASIIVPQGDAYKDQQHWAALYRRVLDEVRALPGVESAGTVDALPFSGENNGAYIRTGDPGEPARKNPQIAEFDRVSSDYLQTIGVRLLQGRWFQRQDESIGSSAAIVDEVAARRFWPGQDAIGRRLCIDCLEGQPQNWKQVVGVVNNVRHFSVEGPAMPDVYVAERALEGAQFLVLRTRRRPMDTAAAVRRIVGNADPNVPVYLSADMSSLVGDSVSDRRFTMALLAITGILALLLAAAGVYAVVSYATSRRTREIGIRMALGATRGIVQGMVLGEGMRMAGLGVAIGLVAALVVIRVLRGVLVGLGGGDPGIVTIAVVLVTATAVVACLLPARRATRVEPMAALRHE
jgi:putative ABC transport system permease protein